MARVKRGVTAHAAHKKIIKEAKGYFGRRKNIFRVAVQAVEKAGQYAYRDRRTKKRNFRALWIQRINAATRELGPHLWPIYQRARQGRYRSRPQGPGRSRRARAAGFRRSRREGESGALAPRSTHDFPETLAGPFVARMSAP